MQSGAHLVLCMLVSLWRCEVCRPIDELTAQLQKAIGCDLTADERLRYGVPDEVLILKQ